MYEKNREIFQKNLLNYVTKKPAFGSRSIWIRILLALLDPDPDPDPDAYMVKVLDPDPYPYRYTIYGSATLVVSLSLSLSFLSSFYSKLLHLLPLRVHCCLVCCDRTHAGLLQEYLWHTHVLKVVSNEKKGGW